MNVNQFVIQELIRRKIKTPDELAKIKRETAKKFKISCPSNVQLLKAYHKLLQEERIKRHQKLAELLRKRPVRTLSGIAVVSLLTKPYPCPGKCIFCPSEKGLPQSYLGGEPAAERALRLNFDPYLQTKKRIESLEIQGHPTDKIEIRIIGATFSVYPKNYKIWFFASLFAAANKKPKPKKADIKDLGWQQKRNETAEHRIVGISIETRPDFITQKEIFLMRKLGITLVELGVQTIFDAVLEKCQRGHGVKETILATKLLKDVGFKVMYQMMPNLPGSSLKKDFHCFETIFENQKFKPDWLKIYPCLVCKGSKLYQIWKKGGYKPYSDKQLIELLIKIKKILPYWTRVARLFRDIPVPKIEAGCKISNLREVVQKEMKKRGLKCKCIRCREVREKYNPKEKLYLFREDYDASDGKEIFLSFEDKEREKLLAFLRLRIPSYISKLTENSSRLIFPVLRGTAIVREIHTYGQMLSISNLESRTSYPLTPQHRGLGKRLIKEAEKITKKEFGLNKIAVISGIGVRTYYRKLGYRSKDTYMIKNFSND